MTTDQEMLYDIIDATKVPYFDQMYNTILSFIDDDNLKSEMSQFLKNGYLGNYVPHGFTGRDDMYFEFSRRFSLALLMISNKETFDFIKNNNITYFHGTNANALPGIKKDGLKSLTSIINSGGISNTGEEWSRFTGRRDFISFTDVLNIATTYSQISSKTNISDANTYNFPVIFGITSECMRESDPRAIQSSLQEVGAFKDVPLDKISVVMVPSDKVGFVKKILGDTIKVMPNDIKYDDYFYYLNDMMSIDYSESNFENFKNHLNQKSKNIDANTLAKKCKLSEVKKAIKQFEQLFGKEFSYDESRPNSR